MNRLDSFLKFLELSQNSGLSLEPGYNYIGTGNFNADILIIGKEAAISNNIEQVNREIINNLTDWKLIIAKSDYQVANFNGSNYSPYYPYKGQLFKIDNGSNGGTSRTWYNYQKIINRVKNKLGNSIIDFHEDAFITETNASPSKKTSEANTGSLVLRKQLFQTSEFIRSFPIILLAGQGYYEINLSKQINEIETVFDVKFTQHKLAGNKDSQNYWIHYSNDNKRLLINTRQLSMLVSDDLVNEIADLIIQHLRH